jgi:hypothetical protein
MNRRTCIMRKFFAISLALVLVLALSVTCFAERITSLPGNESVDVTVSYTDGAAAPATYAVDVAWESMSFTYVQSAQEWDATNHVEKDSGTSGWSDADATVTITNHSNRSVWATVAYVAAGEASGSAAFELTGGAESELVAAAGASVATKTATLTASGIPAENADEAVVGTVTVTIAAAATPAT